MIYNEQQYNITKTLAKIVEQALVKLAENSEETKHKNMLLWEFYKSALGRQLNDL